MQCTAQSCHSLGSGEAADQYYVPVNKTWRLNERMYGGLTGSEWRLVNHVRYRGGTQCQTDNFCAAFVGFNCPGWITKGKMMQCHTCLCQVRMRPGLDKKETVGDLNCGRHQIACNSYFINFYHIFCFCIFWCEIQRSCTSQSLSSLDKCLLR